MSYLHYLCLFAYSGVKTYRVVFFVCFSSLLCTRCCQFLWIVHSWLPLLYSLTFIFDLCLVYPVLPVSLDCPFLIAPSVFSNVYFRPVSCVPGVASFSGLSILDCPFCILYRLFSSCVLCTRCCQFLWIVHSWLPSRYSLMFI